MCLSASFSNYQKMIRRLTLSIANPKKILKFVDIQIRMSMTTRLFIVSLNIKSMTSMKYGFVAYFVKSGSMKAVFTIIYYIFGFSLFPLKVPFVNINPSDGQLTFRRLTLIRRTDNLLFD